MRISDWSSDVCSSDLQAFEDVQAIVDLGKPMIDALGHGREAIVQPLAENLLEILHARPAIETDHVEIDAIAAFEIGGREQMRHQLRLEEHTSELQSLMRISYAVFCFHKLLRITHISTDTNTTDR